MISVATETRIYGVRSWDEKLDHRSKTLGTTQRSLRHPTTYRIGPWTTTLPSLLSAMWPKLTSNEPSKPYRRSCRYSRANEQTISERGRASICGQAIARSDRPSTFTGSVLSDALITPRHVTRKQHMVTGARYHRRIIRAALRNGNGSVSAGRRDRNERAHEIAHETGANGRARISHSNGILEEEGARLDHRVRT